ncbi:MAG: toprim domain-containing protein [Candidatus ainarchaeum sp.]|nr:toprim domain-containing protein [Candidatus ainarchaeum sp.]
MKTERKRISKHSQKEIADKKGIENILETLRGEIVVVEGKRDIESFAKLGINNVYAAVGRMESMLKKLENSRKVVIMTDLDRKGNLLAARLEEIFWSKGINADLETRKKIGRILRIKYFEEIDRKYNKYIENGGYEYG